MLFKHFLGHHLIFAEPYIQFFVKHGFIVDVICDAEAETYLKDKKYFHLLSSVKYKKINKLGIKNSNLFDDVDISNYHHVFMPTIDEWIYELNFNKKLKGHRNKSGIVHYVKKDSSKFIKGVYEYLNEQLFNRIKNTNTSFYPLTLYLKKKYSLQADVIPHFPTLETINNDNSKSINNSFLIFGAIRADKKIKEFLELLFNYEGPFISIKIVGKANDMDYFYQLNEIIIKLNAQANLEITIEDKFVSESEKKELIECAGSLILTNSGEEFSGKMISGVLLDSLLFEKNIIVSSEFSESYPDFDFLMIYDNKNISKSIKLILSNNDSSTIIKKRKVYADKVKSDFETYLNGSLL